MKSSQLLDAGGPKTGVRGDTRGDTRVSASDRRAVKAERPFETLALGLYALTHAVHCNEACWHVHDGHGCEHEGHACGCPHAESYAFEWEPSGEVAERWSEQATSSLLALHSRLDFWRFSAEEIEVRLVCWWQGENRAVRRAAAAVARTEHKRCLRGRCVRGRGFLVHRESRAAYPAPCRDWRQCASCARAYGLVLQARWSRVRGLRAFVVLTMPAIAGDWRVDANRKLMMRAWRRLYERLCRRFDRRPKLMHFKEHAGAGGRLHLNVLWDFGWLDQGELSELAAACGFGPVCHISSVARGAELMAGRPGASPSIRYSLKQGFRVRAYALKTGSRTSAGDDWPRYTRRWSASRAASADMGPRLHNPDWYWSWVEPPPALDDAEWLNLWLLPDAYLPHRPFAPRPPPLPTQFVFSFPTTD